MDKNSPELVLLHGLSESRGEEDEYFEHLRQTIFWECAGVSDIPRDGVNRSRAIFICESGWVDPGRRYFYLKPFGSPGWLFERSGAGWVVSRSEKIVSRDLFLRRGSPWDVVTLFKRPGGQRLRVASNLTQEEIIPFSQYERMMVKAVLGENFHQDS